jgi:DNA-binding LytR/AlgR family response regulator
MKKIREIKQCDSGTLALKIDGVEQEEIPVSRSKVKEIKTIFNL